jgi:hypothetical protein
MSTRRRRVRSIVVRVVVFLLLGAVVNVAMAWGCAIDIRVGFIDSSQIISFPVLRGYNLVGEEMSGAIRLICEGRTNEEVDLQRYGDLSAWIVEALEREFKPNSPTALVIDGRGWPLLSMYSIGDYTANQVRYGVDIRETNDPTEFYTATHAFALPMGFIWPGFAINTVFYAVILWMLFAGPGRVRRWRRIRRGLCAKCAYPVGASDVCTECGAHINKKIKARGSMGLPPPATPAGTGSERVS